MDGFSTETRWTGNVPISLAAKVMKKDAQYIRQGIIMGFLPFGTAYKKKGSTRYSYYISPYKFYQETGYRYIDER